MNAHSFPVVARPPASLAPSAPPTPADREPNDAERTHRGTFADLLRTKRFAETLSRGPPATVAAASPVGPARDGQGHAESAEGGDPSNVDDDGAAPKPAPAAKAKARTANAAAAPRSTAPADKAERATDRAGDEECRAVDARDGAASAVPAGPVDAVDAAAARAAADSANATAARRPPAPDRDDRHGEGDAAGAARSPVVRSAAGANARSVAPSDPRDERSVQPGAARHDDATAAVESTQTSPAFAAMLSEAGDEALPRVRRSETSAEPNPVFAMSSIADAPVATTAGDPGRLEPAAIAHVPVAAAVDGPDFATAFGVQVSVLVEGGVQRAELHLNPAETGPVSVLISVDGSEARIDFSADLAATRQAIERGLPELAAALRDAGFTLAGGGVFDHARERASDGKATSAHVDDASVREVGTGDRDTRLSEHRVSAGGIDVYA